MCSGRDVDPAFKLFFIFYFFSSCVNTDVRSNVDNVTARIRRPNHDEVPRNILQLWNGCEHPDGYAHNNMYGLTLFALAKMFKDAAVSSASSSNDGNGGVADGEEEEEDCDALRSGVSKQ